LNREYVVIHALKALASIICDNHENPLLKKLLLREENKRLKRNWPIDPI
jgi:hypothetical protein